MPSEKPFKSGALHTELTLSGGNTDPRFTNHANQIKTQRTGVRKSLENSEGYLCATNSELGKFTERADEI